MADIPLWQTTKVSPLSLDGNYQVKKDGAVVFNGRVSSYDSQVILNDIARGYVSQGFPSSFPSGGGAMPYDAAVTLNLAPADVDNRYFIDFSYREGRTANSAKTAPIDARIDMRQVIITSRASLTNTSVTLYGKRANGTTTALKTFSGLTSGKGYNLIYPMSSAGSGYVEFYFSDNTAQKFVPVDDCVRYVIYYLNAFGGWDWYNVRGVVKETQTYTPREFVRSYGNATPRDRNIVRYGTDYIRRWRITTDWVDDGERARMWHLFGSNNIYLVDLYEGFAPVPVNIRETEWDARTFKVDGLHRAEITLDQATTLYR